MKPKQLKAFLNLAQNEEATWDTLKDLWESTRSPKIRKAIASNPNANPDTLKMAARLYLEEVLQNPGFEILKLFDSDPWVTKISEAYDDPNAFFVKYGKYSSIGVGGELYARAILISKKLSAEALNCCVSYGPKSALDKALSNKNVFENIQTLCRFTIYSRETSHSPFELETILCLFRRKVLSEEDVYEALSGYGAASVSARKRVYSDFMYSIWSKYKFEKNEGKKHFLLRLFTKFIMVSRAHTLGWISYSDKFTEFNFTIFCSKILKILCSEKNRKVILYDHRRTLIGMIISSVVRRFYSSDRKINDFIAIHEFFKENDILDEIKTWGKDFLNLRHSGFLEEIDKCPIEVKDFFVRMQAVGTWATIGSDLRFKILNDVNEYAYSRHGISEKLIFNHCSLRKLITTDDSTYVF